MELGRRPLSNDQTLAKISSMLDDLNEVCHGNTRIQLADAVTGAVAFLGERNVRRAPTQVLADALTGAERFGPYPVDECRPMFDALVDAYEERLRNGPPLSA